MKHTMEDTGSGPVDFMGTQAVLFGCLERTGAATLLARPRLSLRRLAMRLTSAAGNLSAEPCVAMPSEEQACMLQRQNRWGPWPDDHSRTPTPDQKGLEPQTQKGLKPQLPWKRER